MTPPENRPTNPALPMTDRQILDSLLEHVSWLAAHVGSIEEKIELIAAETAGLSKAFHQVNGHLAVLRANSDMATEQLKPLGVEISELELRVGNIEARLRAMGDTA